MTIRDIRELKQDAREALAQSQTQKDLVVVYTAVLILASILLNVADYFLTEMISGTGGLGNLGTRTMLSTVQTMLPSMLSTTTPVLEEAVMLQAMDAMLPMVIIFGILYMVLSVPVTYRLRMSTFCLIDAPRKGAMNAMRTSRRIMRGNCMKLFKLDLSLWYYHGLLALASIIQMLPMTGILPWSFDASFYGCFAVYLVMLFAIYVLLRNRVELTYAAAYETIREKPKEPQQSNAVVLGNIFDM